METARPLTLDHVALGVSDVRPVIDVLVGELGATLFRGGFGAGFQACQLRVGDADRGMTVELLQPGEGSDFLTRFLAERGEGPHHLTYKTADLAAFLEEVEAAGFRPIGVNLESEFWKEALIHPKDTGSTVIQLAQPALEDDLEALVAAGRRGEVWGFRWWEGYEPPPRAERTAVLERVVVAVADLDRARRLYLDLLGGVAKDTGEGLDVRWPGGRLLVREAGAGEAPGIAALEVANVTFAEKTVAGTRFVGV